MGAHPVQGQLVGQQLLACPAVLHLQGLDRDAARVAQELCPCADQRQPRRVALVQRAGLDQPATRQRASEQAAATERCRVHPGRVCAVPCSARPGSGAAPGELLDEVVDALAHVRGSLYDVALRGQRQPPDLVDVCQPLAQPERLSVHAPGQRAGRLCRCCASRCGTCWSPRTPQTASGPWSRAPWTLPGP